MKNQRELCLQETIRSLFGGEISTIPSEKILANGSRIVLTRTTNPLDLYVVTEDRVEGPVKVYAYIVSSDFILINDRALSSLRIVVIDPYTGTWCFRDEIGKRERKGVSIS